MSCIINSMAPESRLEQPTIETQSVDHISKRSLACSICTCSDRPGVLRCGDKVAGLGSDCSSRQLPLLPSFHRDMSKTFGLDRRISITLNGPDQDL